MRALVSFVALFVLLNSNAYSWFENQVACTNPEYSSSSLLKCSQQYNIVNSKFNTWIDIDVLPSGLSLEVDYLDLGIYDDSTDVVYSYLKKIMNDAGELVGYAEIYGLTNNESDQFLEIVEIYNAKGDFLGASLQE